MLFLYFFLVCISLSKSNKDSDRRAVTRGNGSIQKLYNIFNTGGVLAEMFVKFSNYACGRAN